jgi:L-threonylcarbamoyladenylate synthase
MTIGGDDSGILETASMVLRAGGIAVVPCDTLYGIVGIVPESEPKIRSLKGRGEGRPFLQLLPSVTWIARISDDAVPAGLGKYWPGPLTIVIGRRGGGTVAVRVPDSPLLNALITLVGAPLYSTSVNRSGMPPLWRIREIEREFGGEVDLIVDAGDMPGGSPSTIVDATVSPAKILRQGGLIVPQEDLS